MKINILNENWSLQLNRRRFFLPIKLYKINTSTIFNRGIKNLKIYFFKSLKTLVHFLILKTLTERSLNSALQLNIGISSQ